MGVFFALVTYLLHRRLVRAPGLSRRAALAADLALVGMLLLTLGAAEVGTVLDPAWARPIGYLGWAWLAVVLYLALGLLLIGVGLLIARLTRRVRRRTTDSGIPAPAPSRRGLRIATAVLVVAALGAVGYGTVEANRPHIVTVPVALQDLPDGFEGTRVALITDLHVGPARGADFVIPREARVKPGAAASPESEAAVVVYDAGTRQTEVVRSSSDDPVDPG